MASDVVLFLWGITACACAAVSVGFYRSWRRSHDRLFAWFALAFALLGLERVVALTVREVSEPTSPFVFILRLVAFAIIIVAIVEKNRPARR